MVNEPPGLGEMIKWRRQALGLSARALSLAAGQSASYVTKLERGLIEPSFRAFAKVAVALRLSPQELWFLTRLEAKV